MALRARPAKHQSLEARHYSYSAVESSTDESNSTERRRSKSMGFRDKQLPADVATIKWLLVGTLVVNCIITVSLAVMAGVIISSSQPVSTIMQHTNSITARVDAFTASPAVASALQQVGNVTAHLPTILSNFSDIFSLDNATIVLANIRSVIKLLNRSGTLIDQLGMAMRLVNRSAVLVDAFSDVDPVKLLQFSRDNKLLDNTARILTAAIEILNKMESPSMRTLLDHMFQDGSKLVASLRLLLDEMHDKGVVVRI